MDFETLTIRDLRHITLERQEMVEALQGHYKNAKMNYPAGERIDRAVIMDHIKQSLRIEELERKLAQQQAVVKAARAINDIVIYLPISPGHPDYEKFQALEEAISQLDT